MDPTNLSLVHYLFSAPDNIKFREEIKAVQNQQDLCLRGLETPNVTIQCKNIPGYGGLDQNILEKPPPQKKQPCFKLHQ